MYILLLRGGVGFDNKGVADGGGARINRDGAADSAITNDDEMGLERDREVEEMKDGCVCIIMAVIVVVWAALNRS